LISSCVLFEVVALYYQYALEYPPCVVCIQVRILLAILLLVAVLGLLSKRFISAYQYIRVDAIHLRCAR